jgi:hypothetical protein
MEILEYLIRVTGGRRARQEAVDAAEGLEALQHAEHEAGDEAAKATPKLLFFGQALKRVENDSGGVRSNIFGLSGRLGTLVQMAALASPAIMGLSGALIAVAGSAAAAAGGAAAIGVGGVGALVVGLGSLIAVAAPVVSGLKDVRTAQNAYNLAVKQYGYWSKEAGTAAEHLNAVVAVSGGERVLRISRQWDTLTSSFRRNTAAARSSLLGALGSGFRAANRLQPAFAGAANTGAAAVGRGLRGAFAQLGGPEVQGMVTNLGGVFANVSQSAIRAGTDLFIALGRVAVAAGPYVEMVGRGIERWAHNLRASTTDGSRLDRIVGGLVSNLRSWWNLAVAVGRVFFILLGVGSKSGKSLVDSLTGVVNTFGDWLQKMRDTGQLQKFFRDSARLVRQLFGAARDLLVPMLRLVRTALPPFVSMLRWMRPVLPELVGVFIGWRIATRLLNTAFSVAATIGRWRKLATTLRELPWRSAGRTGGRLFGRAFGAAAAVGITYLLANALSDWVNKTGFLGGNRGRANRARALESHDPTGILKAARHLAGSIGLPVPKMAQGGLVRSRGAALVGDAGPEILDLPAGARVSPLGGGGFGGDIVLKVGQRELARVMNREIQAQMARGA